MSNADKFNNIPPPFIWFSEINYFYVTIIWVNTIFFVNLLIIGEKKIYCKRACRCNRTIAFSHLRTDEDTGQSHSRKGANVKRKQA